MAEISATGQTLVLMIDQTQASARHQVLMVSLRTGGRALPVAWRVRETKGAIGFVAQRELLIQVAALLPEGLGVVLMGDRFYGSLELIALCRSLGWDYRLRLKANLVVIEDGGWTTTGDCAARGDHRLTAVDPTEKAIPTYIAIIQEPGHDEPWIIALSQAPSTYKGPGLRPALGYRGHVLGLQNQGLRSGRYPDPLPRAPRPSHPSDGARPLLGRLDWHLGLRPQRRPCRKKDLAKRPKKRARSLTSLFKRGIRRIQDFLQSYTPLPPLWSVWLN